MTDEKKPKKRFLDKFRPESIRPIKRWADLTPDEQESLAQEFMALTGYDFNVGRADKEGKVRMTLSFKEIHDAFFINETGKVNLDMRDDDPILCESSQVQFQAFVETVIAAMSKHKKIDRLLSNKMQRIRLYYVFEKAKDEISLDPIREQCRLDFEDFWKANKDKIKTPEDEFRLLDFMIAPSRSLEQTQEVD